MLNRLNLNKIKAMITGFRGFRKREVTRKGIAAKAGKDWW
jgi:hypothetical protein